MYVSRFAGDPGVLLLALHPSSTLRFLRLFNRPPSHCLIHSTGQRLSDKLLIRQNGVFWAGYGSPSRPTPSGSSARQLLDVLEVCLDSLDASRAPGSYRPVYHHPRLLHKTWTSSNGSSPPTIHTPPLPAYLAEVEHQRVQSSKTAEEQCRGRNGPPGKATRIVSVIANVNVDDTTTGMSPMPGHAPCNTKDSTAERQPGAPCTYFRILTLHSSPHQQELRTVAQSPAPTHERGSAERS